MIQLRDKESGTLIGSISESQLQFLIDQLEEESETDQDYFINPPTLDMFEKRGADAEEPIDIELPAASGLGALGIVPATVLVAEVSVTSAAQDAGLLPGDLLIALAVAWGWSG